MSDFETTQLRGIIQGLGPPNAGLSAINPATTLATTLYRDRTAITGGYWQCMPNGAGVNAWVPLGPGAAFAAWPPYVVSNQATPIAPYTTVQAAIDAAVADGHASEAAPAVVLLMPGFYPEDVVFRAGVSVRGFAPGQHAVIQGAADCADVAGTIDLADLALEPTDPDLGLPVMTLSLGVAPTSLRLRNVRMSRVAGTPLLQVTKPNVPAIQIDGCEFASVADPVLPNGNMLEFATVVTTGPIALRDSRLTTDVATATALFTQSPVHLVDCDVVGQLAAAPGIFPATTFELVDCDLTAQDQSAMLLTNATIVRVTGGTIAHTIPTLPALTFGATGAVAGTLALSNVTFTDQRTIDPNIDGTTPAPVFDSQPHNALTLGTGFGEPVAAPTTLDQAWDLVVVDMTGTAGDVAVTLPLLVQVPVGHRLTVSNLSFGAPNNVIVTRQGANTIDLLAQNTTLAQGAKVTLQADLANNTWLTV